MESGCQAEYGIHALERRRTTISFVIHACNRRVMRGSRSFIGARARRNVAWRLVFAQRLVGKSKRGKCRQEMAFRPENQDRFHARFEACAAATMANTLSLPRKPAPPYVPSFRYGGALLGWSVIRRLCVFLRFAQHVHGVGDARDRDRVCSGCLAIVVGGSCEGGAGCVARQHPLARKEDAA